MNEREWARRAPIRDVVLAAILRGLDGYPDDDRQRPQYVLRKLADVFEEAGGPKVQLPRSPTVAELRKWAQDRFGDTGAAA